MTEEMISMLDMRILSDPYEEECFLMRYIFDETEKIAQKIITI